MRTLSLLCTLPIADALLALMCAQTPHLAGHNRLPGRREGGCEKVAYDHEEFEYRLCARRAVPGQLTFWNMAMNYEVHIPLIQCQGASMRYTGQESDPGRRLNPHSAPMQ